MNNQCATAMAKKVLDLYVKDTADKGLVVYNVLNKDDQPADITDFWSMTSLLALAVRMSTVNQGDYKNYVEKVVEAMEYYRGYRNDNHAGEGGAPRNFSVYAVPRGTDKGKADVIGQKGELSVFDDQIWVAIEMLNAYNLYGEQKYLQIATELTEYIYLVGNDPYLGGIYWGQAYTTRHACSNAPFIKLSAMLYQATGEQKYLTWAKNIYDFCYTNLRDPADNLYIDLIGTVYQDAQKDIWHGGVSIKNGTPDFKKYSYNSGAMISGGACLYAITGEKRYLDQAKATAQSCRNYFGNATLKDGYLVYPGSDGGTTFSWFNLIMFKGFFDLYKVDSSTASYLQQVKKVLEHDLQHYEQNGFIPTSGIIGWTTGRNSYDNRVLMDHVTNADIALLIQQFDQLNRI